MARGDPVFTKFDNASRHSHKVQAIKPEERWVYAVLNMVCTEELQDALISANYGLKFVTREANVNIRIAKRALTHMANVRLIELTDKWSVFVYDVRDRHRKLHFKKRPIWPPNGETLLTHMGKTSDPYGAILDIRDQSPESGMNSCKDTVGDSENVTQKEQLARPGPTGTVDVKSLLRKAEEESDRKRAERAGGNGDSPADLEPWNQSTAESELELEVHRWFLELWPEGEYDWDAEKEDLLRQVRTNKRGAYNVARGLFLEDRRAGKFIANELRYLNGIAREQAKKLETERGRG